MTTIACSSDCIHQLNGICILDTILINSLTMSLDCIYFKKTSISNKRKLNQSMPNTKLL